MKQDNQRYTGLHFITVDVPDDMTPEQFAAHCQLAASSPAASHKRGPKKRLSSAQLMAEATRINGGPITLKPGPRKAAPHIVIRRDGYNR